MNAPQSYDNNLESVEVDLLCNGIVTENTPIAAIGNVNLISINSMKPDLAYWETPVQEWLTNNNFVENLNLGNNFITSYSQEVCERTDLSGQILIGAQFPNDNTLVTGANYVDVAYESSSALVKVEIFIANTKIGEIPVSGRKRGIYQGNISIPE